MKIRIAAHGLALDGLLEAYTRATVGYATRYQAGQLEGVDIKLEAVEAEGRGPVVRCALTAATITGQRVRSGCDGVDVFEATQAAADALEVALHGRCIARCEPTGQQLAA